jgi:hypothetical protein
MPLPEIARALAGTFPMIAELQVRDWRNQDWCRNIAYARGVFSETDNPDTCNLFEGSARPFDDQARADFERLSRVIGATGLGVMYGDFDVDQGKVTRAAFVMPCPKCDRRVFAYEPGNTREADPDLGQRTTIIDSNWFVVEERVSP